MFVTNETALTASVKQMLNNNPFVGQINTAKNNLSNYSRNMEQYKLSIIDLNNRLVNQKTYLNVENQKITLKEKEIKALEKAMEQTALEFDCKFLKLDVMEAFFKALGLKLIHLTIDSNAQWATISYVRPSKMIESLPVQPLIIDMYFTIKNSVLSFEKARAWQSIKPHGSSTYVHPHINSGDPASICLGNFVDVLNDTNCSMTLEGYQDQVLLLENLLSTYNPDSPYATIDVILDNLSQCSFRAFSETVYEIPNYSTFTFKNSKLGSTLKYNPIHLIGEELYRDWYLLMGQIKLGTLIEDTITRLQNFECDNGYDDYNTFCHYRSCINKVFGVNLTPVNNYSEVNNDEEDNEFNELFEDNISDLIGCWADELNELPKDRCLKFALPDLSVTFEGVSNVFNKA